MYYTLLILNIIILVNISNTIICWYYLLICQKLFIYKCLYLGIMIFHLENNINYTFYLIYTLYDYLIYKLFKILFTF